MKGARWENEKVGIRSDYQICSLAKHNVKEIKTAQTGAAERKDIMLKKKILSILLAIVMVFSVLPMNAFAAGEIPKVLSVEVAHPPHPYEVPYKTSFYDLELPSQVSLVLNNGEKLLVDVVWDSSTYFPDRCYWQQITGTFTAPEGTNCSPTLIAQFSVYVKEPQIVWVEEFNPITVRYGYNHDILSELTQNYPSLEIRDVNGDEYTMQIMWTREGGGAAYNRLVPGRYTFTGHLSGGPWSGWITTSPKAHIDVIVSEPAEIESVQSPEPLSVPYGTDSVAVGKLLRSRRSKVTVNGTEDEIDVQWNVVDSNYNGKNPGIYAITGELKNLASAGYINPGEHGVEITVQVAESVPGEDAPCADDYIMYRTPETILSEDYAFTEDEIAAVRDGISTDARVGYAQNKEQLKALITNSSIQIIVVTSDLEGIVETLIIDRSISFLSFADTPAILQSSSEIDAAFIQVSEQDGSPITDRNIILRFSNVIIECKHAGDCMNIKAADEVADHSAENTVQIEGACIQFNKDPEQAPGKDSVKGLGNIDLVGCTFASLDHTSSGTIDISLKPNGTSTLKDSSFFNLSDYGISFKKFGGSSGEKPSKARFINCKAFGLTAFLTAREMKEIEISDSTASDFAFEGAYIWNCETVKVKNLNLLHPYEEGHGGQLTIRADTFSVDNVVTTNATGFSFNANAGTISNSNFTANTSIAKNNTGLEITTNNVSMDRVNVSGYKTGVSSDYTKSGMSGKITMNNCEITDCATGVSLSDDAELTLDSTKVKNNSEVGIKGDCASISITDSEISGNGHAKTEQSRGGICIGGEKLEQVSIASSIIADNFSRGSGGGLYINDLNTEATPTVNISNGTQFTGNETWGSGGAIYMRDYPRLNVDETTVFSENKITSGESEFPPAQANTLYPNIKFQSASIHNHPLNNYDISYLNQTNEQNITDVITRVSDQSVYIGTPLSELNLPDRAEVRTNQYTTREVDVDWTKSGYDPEKLGEQTLTGTLVLGENMANWDEYDLPAMVTVYGPDTVMSATNLDETIGVFDASTEEVPKLLEALDPLPKESVVTMGDGRTLTVPIIWDKENIIRTPSFESDKFARDYRVKGRLDFSGIPNLSRVPKVEAEFIMYDWWTQGGKIMSFVPLPELSVEKGTTKTELLSKLSTQYPQVCAVLMPPTRSGMYNNIYKMGSVAWDVENSDFDGNADGLYTISGDFSVPNLDPELHIQNLNGIKPEINVRIGTAPPSQKGIVEINFDVPELRQNFIWIDEMGKEPTKEHASGTTPSYASFPESAKVTFDDESEETLNFATWELKEGTENTFCGTLDLTGRKDIKPENYTADITVVENPTDYEVWSVDSEAISLEVYPGTTIEQINALLQENGLAEIDVTCCYQESAESEEPDTFAYLFCDIAIADESTNSQYNKDVPGEYDLIANLPSNFYDFGCIGEIRATTTVHVTVLEPLEIVRVKPAEVDAYQSFDFENISNIPTQVTAVLEDGQEISIDATWTPENYAKDVAAQQTVLGELGDLPSMAKLPTDKEIVPALLVNVIPVNYEITQVVEEDWLTVDGGLTLAEITERYQPKKTVEISSVTEGIEAVTNYEVRLILEDAANPEYDSETIAFYDVTATLDLPDNITYVNPEGSPFDVITVIPQAVDVDAESLEATAITTVEDTPFAELALPETVLVPLTNGKTVSLPVDWGTGEGYDPSPEGLTEDNPVDCEITGVLTDYPDYINGADIPVTLKITVTRPLIYTIESISPARFPEIGSMDINLGTGLEAICGMLESTTVQVTARSRSGAEVTVPITFSLRQEENPNYDPMAVGEYTLVGYLPLEDNFVNPNNIQVQVVVKTNKYNISNVTPVRVPGVISGTPFAEVPLPETVTVTRSDKKTDSVGANWIEGNYNPTKIGNQTVKGTLVTPLPVHLENPNNRYPMAMVTVVNPTARIIEMEQVFEEQNSPMLRARQKEEIVPGYAEYKYKVKLQHDNGTVTEEIISLYKSIN